MNGFVFKSALQDYLRPGRVLVWLGVVMVVVAAGWAWRWLGAGLSPDQSYSQLMDVLVFRLLALASAVFSTMVIGQEIEQRTLVYLLTRPIQRSVLLVSRWLASVAAVAVFGGLLVVAAAVSTLGLGGLAEAFVLRDLLIVVAGALAYGALFLLVSMLFSKPMIWCLLFAFGWETFVPNMPGDLFYVSVFTYVKSLAVRVPLEQDMGLMTALAGGLSPQNVPVLPAALVLAGIVVVFGALSLLRFQRFEYTPKEEAD